MTLVKRLKALVAVLGAAAVTAAVGTTLFGDARSGNPPAAIPAQPIRPDGAKVVEDIAANKFSTQPAITFQIKDGDTLFAWQVKPELAAAPAQPRDVLVMVDTSASQAGLPLKQARQIIEGLAVAAGKDDRVSVWTVSTPAATRALTKTSSPRTATN